MTEAEAMARALTLAWRGWGRVAPNPLVGAVVLRDGVVVGEGWHAEHGEAHAERAALAGAGEAARGSTVVVTLEPCAHDGKQPACARFLHERGVARVCYALPDPNPVARGGAAWLAGAGVAVERLPEFEAGVAVQNARFLHAVRRPDRAWVALKLAVSLDGFIADARGGARWVSGPEAREWVQWLRAGFDGLAVGGITAREDDPALTVRGSVMPRVPPRPVVVTRGEGVPAGARLLGGPGRPLLSVVGGKPGSAPAGAEILGVPRLADLPAAWRAAGLEAVLVEGGGELAGALLDAGLVDRVYWIAVPTWLGAGRPAVAGLAPREVGAAERWTVVERLPLGGDTLLVMDRTPCSPGS